MRAWRRVWARLKGAAGWGRTDADATLEFESHIAMMAEELAASGMDPVEARRAARIRFGNLQSASEAYRDQRSLPFIDQFLQDGRFAFRSFTKRPGFTAVVILSLGLGIGVTTTIYTWLKAVYLNPLPRVRDARSLVTINAAYKDRAGYSNTYEDFVYIRDHAGTFEGFLAHEFLENALSDGQSVEMTNGGIVSGSYFDVLGTPMEFGRGFRPEEDAVLDRNPVIVISYGLWQRRFGGQPGVVGRQVLLNRTPFTVIGVAARGFSGVYGGLRQDYWVPLHMARAVYSSRPASLADIWVQITARPKPGASLDAIQSRLDVLSAQMRESFRKTNPDYRAQVYPLHKAQRGIHAGAFEMVRILAIAVCIVLLLACLNVANLLIARATERTREVSVRLSLGASRERIVRQLFTESMLLALAGGVVGLILAFLSRGLPSRISFPGVEVVFDSTFDWTVFVFLFLLSLMTALLFGFAPALETSRVSLTDSLKEGGGQLTAGRRRNWLRRILVVAEVSLSTASVAAAVLLSAHLFRLMHADRGVQSEKLLTAGIDLSAAGFPDERGQRFYRQATEDLQSAPGIESAAWTTFIPMSPFGGGNNRPLEVRGYAAEQGTKLSVVVDSVSPGYLQTLGIPLAMGREFEWSDDARSTPVMMVNQAFVERYLKKQEAVGAQVKIGDTWRTIVGVHRDYLYRSPEWTVEPAVFLPLSQDYQASANLVVRARSDPSLAAAPVRRVIQRIDSNIPVFRLMTMDALAGFQYSGAAMLSIVLTVFGTLACILAAIGLYGVLATFVAQRRREFGIRSAMGATPGDLRRMVLSQSTRLALVGVAAGVVLSVALVRLLESQVFGLKPDYLVYFWAAAGTGLTAIVSSIQPVRRAARLDPTAALRCE